MNFDSPTTLLTECDMMLLSQQTTMRNRTLINRLFNGESPFTEEEQRTENLKSNVNFLEATRIASNATSQLNNAFFKGDRFFTVRMDKGPTRMRSTWSAIITKELNKELKRSRLYKTARESAHAQVVLHGPGPLVWRNRHCPIPSETGVDDILLPQGTSASMDNLDRFAIYSEMTWHQLVQQVLGPNADSGWNTPYVTSLLQALFKKGVEPVYQGNRWLFPEKLAEDVKEGAINTAQSALPKVMVYNFFYLDEKKRTWNRKMILDYGSLSTDSVGANHPVRKYQDFLYQRDNYANDWSEIIHWYMGNCSNVAPYRYYSIRSIGYLLYGVCMIQNKMRNRISDHVFQNLLTWFRNVSDDNREKLGMIDLQNFGVMPDGVSMVTANERHQVDWNLVTMQLNQNRQLMAESSASFIPDMNLESGREMTATEALVRQNTSITLTSAVLGQMAEQAVYEYREICRRFCIKGNQDPMAVKFRERIQKQGVPLDMLDCEAWEIIPEQTVGGGNKAVELTVTQALMQEFLPNTDPEGQRIILRRRYLALTDNADEALTVVPDGPMPPSNDVQYAQSAYAVLMLGVPFAMKEGVNHVTYAAMLMQMSQVSLSQITAAVSQPNGNAIAADKIVGLFNVFQHVQEQINFISRDERKRDIAKNMFKALVEMSSVLTQAAKQLMANEEQSASGVDPETLAKIENDRMKLENQLQIDQMKAGRKQELKDVAFLSDNQRRNAMTQADVQRKLALTNADIAAKEMTADSESNQNNKL